MTYPWAAGDVLNAADLNAAITGSATIGSVLIWAGTSASIPTGYIVCDGASLATAGTYNALFTVIQYRYGGSGANFNLPKMDALYVPIGSILHDAATAGARQTKPTLASSNHQSTGHAHTLNSHSSTGHAHTFATMNTNNAQSSGHTHTYNAVGTGNHDHSHGYYKPNTSRYLTNTNGANTATHNHTAATTLSTNADSIHAHSGTPSVNATSTDTAHTHNASANTADTAHSHTLTGSIFVFLIKFA